MDEATVALDASADALSDVLEQVRLQGGELSRVVATAGVEVRHPEGVRMLHIVEQGPAELFLPSGERHRLGSGDLVLFATGSAHRLLAPPESSWLSGRFRVDEAMAGSLLAVLPPVVVIPASEVGQDIIPMGAFLLAEEFDSPSAGSMVMVSRILDLLFVRALRVWGARDDAARPGWLTAALDRTLGPALSAMHREPERTWEVEELARLSALSRAAFSARFTRLMGEPPGRYLARLRLAKAAERLAATREPIGLIGSSVGYVSEAAFSRAFAREYGMPPRDWRAARHGGDGSRPATASVSA